MATARPLNQLIYQLLESLGIKERVEEHFAFVYWDSAVGKQIAAQTEPKKIVNGTLFVKVSNTIWRNELTFMKPDIIGKLNHKIGKNVVKDIKFY
ncbi:MAG: hypothetical protein Kow0037_22550 [Calditrichia bacterium]